MGMLDVTSSALRVVAPALSGIIIDAYSEPAVFLAQVDRSGLGMLLPWSRARLAPRQPARSWLSSALSRASALHSRGRMQCTLVLRAT